MLLFDAPCHERQPHRHAADRHSGGVSFSLPLAGPFTRAVAFFIDFVAIMAAMNVIAPILRAMQFLGGDTGVGLAILIQFVCMEGARMAMELLWRGQTLGKKVMASASWMRAG